MSSRSGSPRGGHRTPPRTRSRCPSRGLRVVAAGYGDAVIDDAVDLLCERLGVRSVADLDLTPPQMEGYVLVLQVAIAVVVADRQSRHGSHSAGHGSPIQRTGIEGKRDSGRHLRLVAEDEGDEGRPA